MFIIQDEMYICNCKNINDAPVQTGYFRKLFCSLKPKRNDDTTSYIYHTHTHSAECKCSSAFMKECAIAFVITSVPLYQYLFLALALNEILILDL